MRYLVAPSFSQKVLSLPSSAMHAVASFLKTVEAATKEEMEAIAAPVSVEDETIYVHKQDDVRLLFTFGSDTDGDYVLILDLIVEKLGFPGAVGIRPGRLDRDPRSNSQLNPRVNTLINPRTNTLINPRTNTLINPRTNTLINPRTNTLINPRTNTLINPRTNTLVNPRTNSTINPKYNWAIDPTRNPALDVPRLYDLNLNVEGFVVRANDKVQLVFGPDREFTSFAVKNPREGFVVFNSETNDWIEHWVPDNRGRGGLLRFSADDNEWIGIVV